VAKIVPNGDGLTRGDVLRARRLVHYRQTRGQLYAAKWPRKRGPATSVMQRAWIDQFTQLAKATKSAPGIEHDNAEMWTSGMGVYWRDIIHSAATGKLILSPGGMRVTTPTVMLQRLTNQAVAANTVVPISLVSKLWDNYTFWGMTVNPTRLTFKESGLYLFGASVIFTGANNSNGRALGYRVNGTDYKAPIGFAPANAISKEITTSSLWFFNSGDYLEVFVYSGSTETVQCTAFWAVAITPEAVV